MASGAWAQSPNGITMTVEGLYLQRGDKPGGPSFMTRPTGTTNPVAATDPGNLDLDSSGGGRVMLGVPAGGFLGLSGTTLEIGGFWTGTFFDNMLYIGPDENHDSRYDNHPGNEFQSFNADFACCFAATLKNTLYGFEANVVAPMAGSGFRLFAGPRFISYRETLGAHVYDDMFSYIANDFNIDDIKIEVSNDLFGAQIGAEASVPVAPGIVFTTRISGGLYANRTEVESMISSRNNFAAPLFKSNSSTEFAQGIEILPTLTFELAKNLSLNLGGHLLYLHGVTEATRQFEGVADADAGVVQGGSAIFYGARAGLTIRLN
ncbi:MAG: hypothetical protein JNM89_15530 [Hyphomicrobiaceae bacterium]|nr:hypothetical protein [Hyphomicrobiaceae bacterium]